MADIVPVTPSASYTVWAEDFGSSGVVQRVKVVLGTADADGGNVGVTNPMPVSGVVSVSAMPAVSISVSAVLGTVVTVLGTQVVSVVPGVSVNALVTGPVSVSAMPAVSISVSAVLGTVVTVLGTLAVNVVAGGAAPGTTAATQSAISAQVVWLAPTQTINATVNTIAAGFSVNALVTGPVSISAMPAISISVSAALGTIITILGTQVVSVVPGVSVNALVTGPVSISAMPAISISVSAALGTVITILGTQVVSVVPGLSVSALVSISVMPAISISVSAALGTVITVLGTQIVSVALLNFTTATPTVTATGPIVWLANTVTVTVTATVTGSLIVSGVTPTTAMATGVSAGLIVVPKDFARSPVMIALSSTVVGSNTTMLMTVHTGNTFVATGTSAYAVPAGMVLRIYGAQIRANISAVTSVGVLCLVLGTATASISFTSTAATIQLLQFNNVTSVSLQSIGGLMIDISGSTTLCAAVLGGTSCSIAGGIIQGYLF